MTVEEFAREIIGAFMVIACACVVGFSMWIIFT